MSEEYRARVFKSGNSLALRLPKALGLEEGSEMMLREVRGRFEFEPVAAPRRKFDIAKVAGSAKGLSFIRDEDRIFEERPSLWDELRDAQGKSKD